MATGSVGSRLSLSLAVQGVIATVLICTVIFFDTQSSLRTRQSEILENRKTQILHLFREARDDATLESLKHKLDDFFVGHDDVAIRLVSDNGELVYSSSTTLGAGARRFLAFPAPSLAALGRANTATATIELNVEGDSRLLRRLTLTLVVAAASASALAAVTGLVLVRRGLRPLHRLAREAQGLSAGAPALRLGAADQPSELLPLVQQFNELLGRLDRAYKQLEGFNSDVAHELRTPLATLISSAEVTLRRSRSGPELTRLIGSNLEELRRLAGIVQDMLFLSRADRGGKARLVRCPSLAAVASSVGEYHEAAMEDARLRLAILGDAAGAWDVPLVKAALSNLLANATRYAHAGTEVQVRIEEDQSSSRVRLSVINHGQEIAPEHLAHIFDRFYRVDRARTSDQNNHGLGLAIVSAIARMHGGIVFAHSNTVATEVGLTLPVESAEEAARTAI